MDKRLNEMNFSDIRIIAQNFEKYMSFTCGNFMFLDSFAFLSSSLDTLANNLTDEQFIHTLGNSTMTKKQKN